MEETISEPGAELAVLSLAASNINGFVVYLSLGRGRPARILMFAGWAEDMEQIIGSRSPPQAQGVRSTRLSHEPSRTDLLQRRIAEAGLGIRLRRAHQDGRCPHSQTEGEDRTRSAEAQADSNGAANGVQVRPSMLACRGQG